jgi:hypothetical protein
MLMKNGYSVEIHGVAITSVRHASLPVAKNVAAEKALPFIQDQNSESSLKRLCTCRNTANVQSTEGGEKYSPLRDATNLDPSIPSTKTSLKRECSAAPAFSEKQELDELSESVDTAY